MNASVSNRKTVSDPVLSLPLVMRALKLAGEASDDTNLATAVAISANRPWNGDAADLVPAAYLTLALAGLARQQSEGLLAIVEPAGAAKPAAGWDRAIRDEARSLGESAAVLAAVCAELAGHVAVTSDAEVEAEAAEAAPAAPSFGLVPVGPGRTARQADLAPLLAECEEIATGDDDADLALACLFARPLLSPDGEVCIELAGAYISQLVQCLHARAKGYAGHPRHAAAVVELFTLSVALVDVLKALVDDAGTAAREVSK